MNIQHFTNADDLRAHYAKLFKRPSVPVVPRARVSPTAAWLTKNPRPISYEVCFDIPWYWDDLATFDNSTRQVKAIKLRVADEFKVAVADMEGQSRKYKYLKPRQKAMAQIYLDVGWSLPRIGRSFGNRDHTTVLHAVRRLGVWARAKA